MYNSGHNSLCLFIIHIISLHGMSFSWTSLAVSHYRSVKAIKYILKYRKAYLLKYILLGWMRIECMIKHEGDLILFIRLEVFDYKLIFISNSMKFLGMILEFLFIKGTKTAINFDISLFFLHVKFVYNFI